MSNLQEELRIHEDQMRRLKGLPRLRPPKQSLADKDEDVKNILSEFRLVMANYKKANADWWYGSLLNMKQQFMLGDMEREFAPLEDKAVDIAMSCSIQPKSITVTHGFRSTRYVPISNSSFIVVKRPVIKHHMAARPMVLPSNWVKPKDIPVGIEGKFDDQGMAKVELPTCEAGYNYRMLINTDISQEDVDALHDSYQRVIDRYATWLSEKWNGQQRAAWEVYIATGLDLTQAANAFLKGMLSQIKLLYDTVQEIWKWINNVDKYAAKLAKFIKEDGVKELKALVKEGGQALEKGLTLLSDEILVFILAAVIKSYFQLLTPQQIVDFVADAFGSLVTMIVLYLVLPGGVGKLVLDGLDTLSVAVQG